MNTNTDPLAHASEVPDVAALIHECETAMQQTNIAGETPLGRIARAENIQLNRRPGKSHDGKRWQRNAAERDVVRPYDGCPDSDIHLADELVLAETDILCMAAEMAQLGVRSTHVTVATAAATAELRAVAEWCGRATQDERRNSVEMAAQMTAKLGWCVLNPGWRTRWELIERELDLESLINRVAQMEAGGQQTAATEGAGGGAGLIMATALSTAILDPTLEAQAVEIIGQLFSYVPPARRRRIVRELREEGHTKFLDRQLAEKRPTERTLIPGYDYWLLGAPGELSRARGHLVIERLQQADLESVAASEGWNEEFTAAVINTMGEFSAHSEAMHSKNQTMDGPARDLSIEIWTTCIYQFDEDVGAAGWYYTVFSPHLKPAGAGTAPLQQSAATARQFYAKHFLLSYACGAPFVQSRRMVEGPGVDDSRGVPEMVENEQAVMKMLQDAQIVVAHKQADPPVATFGYGASKMDGWNKPGASMHIALGTDVKKLGPEGDLQSAEVTLARLDAGTRRRFALPNNTDGSHPSAWQTRQLRIVKRFLAALAEVRTQQVVLCYQELDESELAAIIGHWPILVLEEVLKHRITLSFDVRGLDAEWRNDLIGMVKELLGIDRGGTIDTNATVQLLGSAFDPTLISAIVLDPAGASAKAYRKVSQDILEIMTGNPPPLVEMDATAGMQLQMAMQVIGQNEKYQRLLMADEQVRENLKTYVENLQHSQQETQISPQQGRLGVAATPQRPVQKGAS